MITGVWGGGGGKRAEKSVHPSVNPFTAPACKISRLKNAPTHLQTIYFQVLHILNLLLRRFTHVTRVPGEIKRSRDLRGGRWSWTLTFAQKRSWVGRWSWAEQVGRLLLRVVQVVHQQRCNRHRLSDSVQHSSWNSNCAVRKSLGNGEGSTPPYTSIVLAAVHSLSSLFRAVSAVEPFTLSPPSHSVPVPNRSTCLCGRKATLNQTETFSRCLYSAVSLTLVREQRFIRIIYYYY